MPQSNQEHTARRFQPSSYECELPLDLRSELEAPPPKRPRILGRPRSAPTAPRWPFYVVMAISLIVLAGALYATWRQGQSAERARTKAISQPALALQPTPTAPGPAKRAPSANNPPAPRATLVHRVPRATLVKLPPPKAQLAGDLPP